MRKLLIELAAFVLAGLIVWGLIARHDDNLVKQFKAEQKIAVHDSVNADLAKRGDSVRVVYQDRWHTYTQYRDRVVDANPTDTALKGLAQRCDQVIVTCADRQRIDSARIANLAGEVSTLKKIKAAKASRASAFALAGYDWYNGKPIAQLGGDFRIVGALSVTGYLEAARSNIDGEKVATRGVVAAKFTFR